MRLVSKILQKHYYTVGMNTMVVVEINVDVTFVGLVFTSQFPESLLDSASLAF